MLEAAGVEDEAQVPQVTPSVLLLDALTDLLVVELLEALLLVVEDDHAPQLLGSVEVFLAEEVVELELVHAPHVLDGSADLVVELELVHGAQVLDGSTDLVVVVVEVVVVLEPQLAQASSEDEATAAAEAAPARAKAATTDFILIVVWVGVSKE